MNLYKKVIDEAEVLLSPYKQKELPLESSWKESEEKVFLFTEDAEVNLGASHLPSAYFYGYFNEEGFLGKDSISIIGKDLYELSGDVPFSHIFLFEINDENNEKDQEYYRIFRNIEYRRYKVNPEGYMLKVNTNLLREGAYVSKDAIDRKISFKDIGMSFLSQFKKEQHVRYVRQIFITDSSFPYDKLLKLSQESEGITVALDHIMKKLKMDCRTCSFKDICDEIEGMRELHKANQ